MKQTTIEEIREEEKKFLGKELRHKEPKHEFVDYTSMTAELLTATPWDDWVRGAAYASLCTWDCSCCKPIDSMSKKQLEDNLMLILSKRPISVALENAKFMFRLTGISRAITHQLVRHRQMAFGQQSLRVSNPGHDPIRLPQWIWEENDDADLTVAVEQAMIRVKDLYFDLVRAGCPPEQARAVLPIGITTKICVTMTLRDMIAYFRGRTSAIAQGEHEYMVRLMMKEMKSHQPKYYKFLETKVYNMDGKKC